MQLIDPDLRAQQFVDEWNNGESYLSAHTSGSTGKPKDIKLLKSDMRISAQATCQFFNIDNHSLLVCPLSTDYIAGKMMIVRGMEANCRLIMESPSNQPLHSIESHQHITLLPIVPSQARWLIDNADQLPGIENIIVGGAPLTPNIETELLTLDINVWATYGMTETCSHVALRPIGDSIYQALPHINFAVTDDNRLIIKSSSMSWHELVTNDIVQLLSPTTFIWKGRADNVINSGGIKLHPEAIENELSPYIPNTFYVKGVPDEKLGEALQLVIEDPDGVIDPTTLLCTLKENPTIHPYHIPRSVVTMPCLKRTPNGKIIRQ